MAVSNVSTVDQDNWQLITTATASTVATVTASGISGCKRLMVVFKLDTFSANAGISMRFNSDSTSGNYGGMTITGTTQTTSDSAAGLMAAVAGSCNGYAIVENANNGYTGPKVISSISVTNGYGSIIWQNTADAITSVTVLTNGGQTFSGTVSIYGIAA